MEKEEKKLAFLKNPASWEKKENFYANYFRDLEIIAVSGRTLSPGVIRHKSFSCPENAASLEYIRKGKVFLHLDKAKILLRGPCIFWITGEFERYRFEYVEDSPEYEHIWADFRGERALRIRKALFHLSDLCYREIPEENNPFEPLFQELLFAFRNDREKEHNHMVIVLEKLLAELYLLAESGRESPTDPYGIEALAEHFRKNPFDHYDIARYARKRGLSLMHLRTLFKEFTGLPPGAFLAREKIRHACRKLESGRMRISEVAEECRYPDPAGFSRAFSRIMGCSPRQWIKVSTRKEKENSPLENQTETGIL